MAQPDDAGNLISRLQLPDSVLTQYALRASAIPYGQVNSTSTATEFTATVPGINTLKDGVCVLLKNGVVTSASGFTINVNGLGAKPCYTNLAAATRETTIFNINYTMLFVYDEDRVSGGCWICYRGYDANTNTIGYQLRTNSSTLNAADKGYRYRLWFTSADGSKWVPANKSTSTDATTSRTPNTTPINPFGPIVYNSTNGTVNANASLPAATLWQQYTLTIGYSFNEPGGAMTFPAPVYLKCTPQTNGSAVMVELVQALPSTNDGYIYILLGRAYSATAMELIADHPVFYHDGTAIRLWTGAASSGGVSSVTVSQTVTSGTEIAKIDVDGTSTKLYTPTVPAPLIGTTANTTPTQVLAALQAGKNVYITHTDTTFGNISFTSFAYSASLNTVQAQAVVRVYILTAVTLSGDVSTDTWTLGSDALEHDPIVQYIHVNGGEALPNINNGVDITIPTKTSDLTNDSGFITSAPVTSVNGQTGAVTLSIPSTAADVNALANTGGNVEGDVTLKAPAATNSPGLIFQRGTLTDNYNDWMIQDRGGYLYFDERGQGSSAWTNRVMFNTTGGVVATSFSGSGASLTGVVKPADIANMQTTGNLVTSVSASSTNSQYPSAKCVYDLIGNVETLLAAI